MKKKLIVITDYWPTEKNPIAGNFVLNQLNVLKDDYSNVVVICCYPFRRENHIPLISDNVKVFLLPVINIPQLPVRVTRFTILAQKSV